MSATAGSPFADVSLDEMLSEQPVCPECGRLCPEDDRVLDGMKCSACAYPRPSIKGSRA